MSSSPNISVSQAIEDLRAGKIVIVVDDQDRENEGDLTMAADLVTPEAINFMASHGRGLICLALSEEKVDELRLPMMTQNNRSPHNTAFTVSVDAQNGISTGISARERAHTIKVAVSPDVKPEDLVTPGHVFPLRAKRGGVLVRSGHTEGAVDLARMAGLSPAGIICEIMREDGEMARMPDLEAFAIKHGLGIVQIAELIQYRMSREDLVKDLGKTEVKPFGSKQTCVAHHFSSEMEDAEFVALVLGDVTTPEPVLVRVQMASLMRDVFALETQSDNVPTTEWMRQIEQEGRGVLLYIMPRVACTLTHSWMQGQSSKDEGHGLPLRDIGIGSQILARLGIKSIRLLTNNPRRLAGIEGYGIHVVDCLPSGGSPSKDRKAQ